MSSQSAASPEHDAADQPADDAQYFRQILHDLIDLGNDLARDIHQQAMAPTAPGTVKPDFTAQFDRIARCIRRTILLARKVAEPIPNQASPPSAQPNRVAARKRIIRVVEDAIQHRTKDPDSAHAELLDRLDSPDLEEELTTRSIKEIITDIIRDLGMAHMPGTHPWKRRTPDDIEALRVLAARPPTTPGSTTGPVDLLNLFQQTPPPQTPHERS